MKKCTIKNIFLLSCIVFTMLQGMSEVDMEVFEAEEENRGYYLPPDPVPIVTNDEDLVNKVSKKSKVKFKNYAFSYISSSAVGEMTLYRTRVLVKNQKVVSVLQLYTDHSFPLVEFVTPLIKAEDLKLAMDTVYGKRDAQKYDKNGYPKIVEEGYAQLIFYNYKEVDAGYTLDPKVELMDDFKVHYEKWKAQNINLYSLSGKEPCIFEIVKNGIHIKTVKRCRHREKNRFFTVEDVFSFVKEQLEIDIYTVGIEYDFKYGYPVLLTYARTNDNDKKIYFPRMQIIDPSNTDYLSTDNSSPYDYDPVSPEKLTIQIKEENMIFSWQDDSDNEKGFKLYVDGKLLATVGRNIATYKIKIDTLKKFINKHKLLDMTTTHKLEISSYNSGWQHMREASCTEFVLK